MDRFRTMQSFVEVIKLGSFSEAAKILGFVNRFGRGIAIAQAALARNDSPPAFFTPGPSFFVVKVPRRP